MMLIKKFKLYEKVFNKVDLKKKFIQFNKLYFNNKLPNIPVEFSDQIYNLTLARFIIYTDNTFAIQIRKTKVLTDSKYEKVLDNILIHEMVHLKNTIDYSIEELDANGSHGTYFMKEKQRIDKYLDKRLRVQDINESLKYFLYELDKSELSHLKKEYDLDYKFITQVLKDISEDYNIKKYAKYISQFKLNIDVVEQSYEKFKDIA